MVCGTMLLITAGKLLGFGSGVGFGLVSLSFLQDKKNKTNIIEIKREKILPDLNMLLTFKMLIFLSKLLKHTKG
jgi:hypothetical protein